MSLINGDTHFLFVVAVNVDLKRYIAKQTNSELKKPFHFNVSLLSWGLVCFLFFALLFWCGKPQITWLILFFFFFLHFNFFSFFKDYNKNGSDFTFHLFFSSQVSQLLRLLIWNLVCLFFFFSPKCSKLQITWFVYSFFHFIFFFLSLKIIKNIRSHLPFIYLFLKYYVYKHTEHYTCVLY